MVWSTSARPTGAMSRSTKRPAKSAGRRRSRTSRAAGVAISRSHRSSPGDILFSGQTGGGLPPISTKIYGDALTGKLEWTFDIIKNDQKSWPGYTGKVGGGGSWGAGVYDDKTGAIYIGTGNAAPDDDAEGRRGDNLYTDSILVLDAKTGKLKWYHQEVPNDAGDNDLTNEIMTINEGGKDKLIHLNKGGFVTVLDKETGKVENVCKLSEDVTGVDSIDPKTGALIGRHEAVTTETSLVCPSPIGARSRNDAAYNPNTKLWY